MTKPANFPGRRNARRIAALERIQAQLERGTKANSGRQFPLTAADESRLNREGDAIALRILPADRARSINTKKTKALGWSAARASYRSGKLSA